MRFLPATIKTHNGAMLKKLVEWVRNNRENIFLFITFLTLFLAMVFLSKWER